VAEQTVKATEESRRSDPLRVVTMVLLAAMILAQIGLSVYLVTYVRDQRIRAECVQSAFNETNSALATTVGAASRDRRGLLTLLTSLTNPELSSAQRATALEDYKRQLAANEAERASNPLPNRTC
jgi:hypothetical protein